MPGDRPYRTCRGASSGIKAALEIRPATIADAGAVAPLLEELGYPSTREQVSRRLARMTPEEGTRVLVTTDSDRIVGVVAIQELTSLHSDDRFAQLTLLVVTSARRRRGVGRRLVAAAESWAGGRGCARMLVSCGIQRKGAHAFYARLGYEHTARRYSKALQPGSELGS